jgi:hypothetical protein
VCGIIDYQLYPAVKEKGNYPRQVVLFQESPVFSVLFKNLSASRQKISQPQRSAIVLHNSKLK